MQKSKETPVLEGDTFYRHLAYIVEQPLERRYQLLTKLHTETVERYINAITHITPERAGELSSTEKGQRTVAQVVGHIAAWEQWHLQAMGHLLSGVRRPPIMELHGYIDPDDGQIYDFKKSSEFNHYQAQKQSAWSWDKIRTLAINTGTKLHAICTNPILFSPQIIEATESYTYRTPYGVIPTTVGFYLQMVTIEHEAEEHKTDIYG